CWKSFQLWHGISPNRVNHTMTNRSAIALSPAISDTEQPASAKIIDFEVARWLREVSVSTSAETLALLETALVAGTASASSRSRTTGTIDGTDSEIELRRILDLFESPHDDGNDVQFSNAVNALL